MLYVIKSIGKKNKNKPVSLKNQVEIIKIGYTEDDNYKKRFSNYDTHNKIYNILFKIPKGTQEDEHELHRYFKRLRYLDREWFLVDEDKTIENFFKSHKTIESIRKALNIEDCGNRCNVRDIIKRFNVIFSNFILESRNNIFIVDKLKEDFRIEIGYSRLTLNIFYNWLRDKKIIDFNVDEVEDKLRVDERHKEEFDRFFKNYNDLSTYYNRLKYLSNFEFSSEEIKELILNNLTEKHFKEYYKMLGPLKIKELSFDIASLRKYFSSFCDEFDENSFKKLLQDNFVIGKKYFISDVKKVLQEIYDKVNYPLGIKKAKSTDLLNWFEVKEVKLSSSNKRCRAYLILKFY